jgi:hypothetical protein
MKYNSDIFVKQYPIAKRFLYHLIYYRELLKAYQSSGVESEFWAHSIDAHLLQAAIHWCMIFGTDRCQPTHLKKLSIDGSNDLEDSFTKKLFARTNLTPESWKTYWKSMNDFRNQYAAHCEIEFKKPVPDFSIALDVLFLYDDWIREIISPDTMEEPPLKTSMEKLMSNFQPIAKSIFEEKASKADDSFKATVKKWMRDPNGWIAICTIILVFSGFWALRISKDTENRQLRAYVAPSNLRSSVTGTLLTVEFNIQNFGQTPAKSCNIRGNASILPFPLLANYDLQVPKNPIEQKSRIDPGPITDSSKNNVKKSFILSTGKASIILAEDTSTRIYVYGVLNYEDIFDEAHYTNFCYFMTLDKNPKKDSSGHSFRNFTWSDCDQHTDFN